MSEASYVTSSRGEQVLVVRQGGASKRAQRAQSNNISAAKLVAELVRTSLGPRGMDKMLVDSMGDVTITNDGATMLKDMDVQHPAAKMIIEVARTVDDEVGDGTTSSVVFAGALLANAEGLMEMGIHPMTIINGYRKASNRAQLILNKIAVSVAPTDRITLARVARTSMASKLVSNESLVLGKVVVDSLLRVAEDMGDGTFKVDLENLKLEKKVGGSINETCLVMGIALEKEVSHSGMPKRIEGARIALVSSALEIEKTEFDSKINITAPAQMQQFLDQETGMLKRMVEKISSVGANVLICQKGVDDMAQHYLSRAGILTLRRVKESDMARIAKATGARIVSGLDDISKKDIGQAGLVEERKIEDDKWTYIEGCKNPRAVTVFVRGGTQRVVDEVERCMHDAIMVTKDVLENPWIVGGGGAVEEELSYRLMKWSSTLEGREQLAAEKYAEALEAIPLALASNAGFDQLDIQVALRERHGHDEKWCGVDVLGTGVRDMFAKDVIEPVSVKQQIISSATECACMLLRIDDVIPSKRKGPSMPQGGMPGMD
ncbi:MAG: thermosome subunit beta [Thaumarchaeota archaeon]|nr:thermosome subunit beta [Nitrososphaerota archaeon]